MRNLYRITFDKIRVVVELGFFVEEGFQFGWVQNSEDWEKQETRNEKQEIRVTNIELSLNLIILLINVS